MTMRIISGQFGGRQLQAVPSRKTRPTTDRVRESLFNMIGPYFSGGSFLDLFAGSGGVGIEAASRGIKHVVMSDWQYLAYRTILTNVQKTKRPELFTVMKTSARSALIRLSQVGKKFNFVYLDPPYRLQRMVKDLNDLSKLHLLEPRALVICETGKRTKLTNCVRYYHLVRQKKYGITLVTIYRYLGE